MTKQEERLINFLQEELGKRLELKGNTLNCYVPELSIDELARVLKMTASIIVAFFWKSGRIITKNQPLNFQLIEELCKSRKLKALLKEKIVINEVINEYLTTTEDAYEKVSRSPVVSVMGHIDHGKSTLLDTICGTKKQLSEEGGITQKISIYPVEFAQKKISFIDTPGHNVFFAMRKRGAAFTDVVVLVIAADDGVMPQTLEVIEHIHNYKLPTIVFVNNKRKSDEHRQKLDRIKGQLQEHGLVAADWGGDVIVISGSAIEEASTNELLENILLLTEIHDWKANVNCLTSGVILDSYISSKEGNVNTVLVKSGKLRQGENIFTNGKYGKIRKLTNFENSELKIVEPGEIVRILGLDFHTEPGDSFIILENKTLVKKIKRIIPPVIGSSSSVGVHGKFSTTAFNLVLLADTQSSLEALIKVVNDSQTAAISFNVIKSEVGGISESVINLSKITGSSLLMFNVKPQQHKIKELSDNNVKWFADSVIYRISDNLREVIDSLREKKTVEKTVGSAEVKKVFLFSQVGKIAGCQMISGVINRNSLVKVVRKTQEIFSGKITSLQIDRKSTREVLKNQECGIVLNGFSEFEIGDQIISYQLVAEDASSKDE